MSEPLKRICEAGVSIEWNGEKIKVVGRLHFLVRSRTDWNEWHSVDLEPVDVDWPHGGCTCRGYNCRRDCRHIRAVLSLVKALRDGV